MFGELSLTDLFLASPTMVVLLICSIITVGFALERTFYFRATRQNVGRFMKELSPLLNANNAKGALEYCRKGKGAVARVMAQAVSNLHRNREDLHQRINTAIEVEQVEMERHLSLLGTMSNIAPLLGLFGTVVGIIRAFADIARTGSGGSSVVAMGVSEALMTTAAGIVVAVIATVFFNTFVRQIRCRVVDMEDAREEFFILRANLLRKAAPAQEAAPKSSATRAPAKTNMDLEPVLADMLK
jgi:biopolymer transport protein ExbB